MSTLFVTGWFKYMLENGFIVVPGTYNVRCKSKKMQFEVGNIENKIRKYFDRICLLFRSHCGGGLSRQDVLIGHSIQIICNVDEVPWVMWLQRSSLSDKRIIGNQKKMVKKFSKKPTRNWVMEEQIKNASTKQSNNTGKENLTTSIKNPAEFYKSGKTFLDDKSKALDKYLCRCKYWMQ